MASGYPDYEGQKSKLYSGADWAAIQATDKNFYNGDVNEVFNGAVAVVYAVPSGKTLYITGISTAGFASAAADYDHFLYSEAFIYNATTATVLATKTGVGGAFMQFSKPIVIDGGDTVWLRVRNKANITCDIYLTAWGYEL